MFILNLGLQYVSTTQAKYLDEVETTCNSMAAIHSAAESSSSWMQLSLLSSFMHTLRDLWGLATSPRLDRIIVHDFPSIRCCHMHTCKYPHPPTHTQSQMATWSNLVDFEILPIRIEK